MDATAPLPAAQLHDQAEAHARAGRFGLAERLFRQAVAADGRLAGLKGDAPEATGPVWIGRFEPRPCPTCAARESAPVWVGNASRHWDCHGRVDPIKMWVRCYGCGLVRVAAPPPAMALAAWRNAHRQATGRHPPTAAELHTQMVQHDSLLRKVRERGYGLAWTRRAPKGDTDLPAPRLLEVGARYGAFMATARWRGFEVVGIEQAAAPARWARENLDLDLRNGTVPRSLPEGPFDVVVLRDVISGLGSPAAALKAIVGHLSEEALVVVSAPSLDHPAHALQGYEDPVWSHPTRLVYFDRESLALTLIRCGLQPEVSYLDPDQPGQVVVISRRCDTA